MMLEVFHKEHRMEQLEIGIKPKYVVLWFCHDYAGNVCSTSRDMLAHLPNNYSFSGNLNRLNAHETPF